MRKKQIFGIFLTVVIVGAGGAWHFYVRGSLALSIDERASRPSPFRIEFQAVRRSLPVALPFPKVAILDSGLDQGLAEKEGYSVPWEWTQRASLAPEAPGVGLWDDLFHGTGLFLELGAKDNGFGLVGLIPEAPLLPVRLGTREEFTSGKIPFLRIRRAFDLAAAAEVRVVVFSLSHLESRWPKREMERLLSKYRSQLLVVAAAGNDDRELAPGADCAYVPICLEAPNLIKVGALDYSRSNRGRVVDVRVASECQQWRLAKDGTPHIVPLKSTSVAVPKVAAVAALLFALRPHSKPEEVAESLRAGIRDSSGVLQIAETVAEWVHRPLPNR